MRRLFGLLVLLLLPLRGQGPLLIAGGGTLPPPVYEAYAKAAGGPGTRVGVITASSGEPKEAFEAMAERLGRFGLKAVHLPVATRAAASDPALLEAARGCGAFWFSGGDQMRVHTFVVGTPLHRLVLDRHAAGGAVGGSSAGAAIMSKIMIQGTDDLSDTAPGTYRTVEGIGLLPGCIVDQHFLRRTRHNRLLSLAMEHPDHLGLGIDEDTALLVKDGRFTVLGNRRVLVCDPAGMATRDGAFTGLVLHLLAPGQGLDLRTRQPF